MAGNASAPVSVVVPCYRSAGTVERAVRSVAAQTLRPLELILVDDASGDGTAALLRELQARYGADWIRILELRANGGPASARNAGWDAARGKYLAFLDADDAWHPQKLELQCAWMEAHPEVAVCGHASRQLAGEPPVHETPSQGEARLIGRASLFVSNPFITPSVMLRRELAARFETGKRHMEDYLLWLELAAQGHRIALLPQTLAYTFKAAIGESGLSAQAWSMEKGELAAFRSLRRAGHIGATAWLALSAFSLLKFLRRLLMLAVGYSPRGGGANPQYLFPAAYVLLTQAMTALLVGAGLLGQSELAADIGIVQAATLGTFFAFSGNARSLILSTQSSIPLAGIVVARLVLLLPLCGAALVLSVMIARVDAALALALVARRAVEWIGELELSASELRGDRAVGLRSLVLQFVLLMGALLTLLVAPQHVFWAILAWAFAPLLPALSFVVPVLRKAGGALRLPLQELLPHFGSTAVTGVSLYAFRALLVLVAGKAVAGDLFAAFAVGSFLGTLYANVLGPSFALHEQRSGRSYLPKWMWSATLAYLAAGVALLAAAYGASALLAATGKSAFFWQALGWSLLGGVLMVAAQRARLGLLAQGRGDAVFGPDVMIHVLLIAAVPVLYATERGYGWAGLYALNALLAFVFYAATKRGEARAAARRDGWLPPLLAFCVFFPLFFLLSGTIYNPEHAVFDSGGVLRNLPLPISLLACFGGVLLLGRYAAAGPALWTILTLLVAMLLSSAAVSGSELAERSKMLLMLQVLLPTFGLVLGAAVDPMLERERALSHALVAAVALIVPAQLVASWIDGSFTLTHDLGVFGVYQHFEYVPVILTCGFLAALPAAWAGAGRAGKAGLAILFGLVGAYAASVYSMSAMGLAGAGIGAFLLLRVLVARERAALAATAVALGGLLGYNLLIRDTDAFHHKFSFLFPADDGWVHVADKMDKGVKPLFGGWQFHTDASNRVLLRLAKYDRAARARLVIEGDLAQGAIVLRTETIAGEASPPLRTASAPGPFRFELDVDTAATGNDVVLAQGAGMTRGKIRRMRWTPLAAAEGAPAPGRAPEDVPAPTARNLIERFADWRLFGSGVLDSPQVFFFGHEKIMGRDVRTSAHNYYIDLIYNFGVLPLVPLAALIVYTLTQLWRQRRRLLASESLMALAAVVLFLVLIESNVKVALRQPYSGIATCFLWGLLLARLAAGGGADRAKGANVTDRLHTAPA
jgi:hypothetical protein